MAMPCVRQVGMICGLLGFAMCSAPLAKCQETEKVTPCQLKDDPAAYNHKLIEVTGFVSHGFEDFGIFDPTCPSWPYVWLEYGGTAKSGTMYCCGVTADRSRPKQLEVENLSIPLLDDEKFREFDRLLQRLPDSLVHATIVGRFFSGRKGDNPKGGFWGGYGHMGCCSLLAIQQVVSVDPHDRQDLDYRASPDQPDTDKLACGYRDLVSRDPYSESIEAQRKAELGSSRWAFDDPRRVASNALARLVNVHENSTAKMKQKGKAQGRFVFEWKSPGKQAIYMIVVSRPYWLSFYSKDPKTIAWVVIAAYEASCAKSNSVTRVR